jgi:hypothetical protein
MKTEWHVSKEQTINDDQPERTLQGVLNATSREGRKVFAVIPSGSKFRVISYKGDNEVKPN